MVTMWGSNTFQDRESTQVNNPPIHEQEAT